MLPLLVSGMANQRAIKSPDHLARRVRHLLRGGSAMAGLGSSSPSSSGSGQPSAALRPKTSPSGEDSRRSLQGPAVEPRIALSHCCSPTRTTSGSSMGGARTEGAFGRPSASRHCLWAQHATIPAGLRTNHVRRAPPLCVWNPLARGHHSIPPVTRTTSSFPLRTCCSLGNAGWEPLPYSTATILGHV